MIIITNKTEFDTVLADIKGGFAIALEGDFGPILFAHRYERSITIFAHRARVMGLTFTGSGANWVGGTVEAPAGSLGFSTNGYGVHFKKDSSKNTLCGAKIRNADRGIVLDQANQTTVYSCDISVRQDGIIANGGEDICFAYNWFHDFYPLPTTCTLSDGSIVRGLSSKDCVAQGGTWKDGDHSDAIQIRNGMKRVAIIGNRIDNISQGIGQMDAIGDAWLDDVTIIGNNVEVSGFHSVTVERATNLTVIGNRTKQLTGRRSPLRLAPNAIVRDNEVLSP